MSSLNDSIREAIDTFDTTKARELIREALKEANAETYFLASRVALDEQQRKNFLQKALDADPFYTPAYEAQQAIGQKAESVTPAVYVAPQGAAVGVAVPASAETSPPPLTISDTLSAKVSQAAKLHQYPWPNAPIRSKISPNTVCIPLARTASGKWINVLYIGSTGHDILGWIEAQYLSEVQFAGKVVNLDDLPFTQFEYNTKQDAVELLQKLSQIPPFSFALLMLAVLSFSIIPLMILMPILDPAIVTPIALVIFLGCIVQMLNIKKKFNNQVQAELGEGGAAIWVQRFNEMRRNKQSVTENMMEDQARIAAMQIAGNLANTYLAKSMTSKSDVTVRYQ